MFKIALAVKQSGTPWRPIGRLQLFQSLSVIATTNHLFKLAMRIGLKNVSTTKIAIMTMRKVYILSIGFTKNAGSHIFRKKRRMFRNMAVIS